MGKCIILCMSLSLWLWSNVCHSEKNTIQAIFCCPCIYSMYVYFESIDGAIPVLQSWLWHTPCPSKNYIINLSQSLDCHQILLYVVQPERNQRVTGESFILFVFSMEIHLSHIPLNSFHENVIVCGSKGLVGSWVNEQHKYWRRDLLQAKRDSTLKKLWHASSSFQRRNAQRHSSPSFLY